MKLSITVVLLFFTGLANAGTYPEPNYVFCQATRRTLQRSVGERTVNISIVTYPVYFTKSSSASNSTSYTATNLELVDGTFLQMGARYLAAEEKMVIAIDIYTLHPSTHKKTHLNISSSTGFETHLTNHLLLESTFVTQQAAALAATLKVPVEDLVTLAPRHARKIPVGTTLVNVSIRCFDN